MDNSVMGFLEIDPAYTQSFGSLVAGIGDHYSSRKSGLLLYSTLLLQKQAIFFSMDCKAVSQHHRDYPVDVGFRAFSARMFQNEAPYLLTLFSYRL